MLSALLFPLRCLFAGFRRALVRRLCIVSRTVRVCVAFLLGVGVAFLLELCELAQPVEMPCLCCNTCTVLEITELAKPVEMPRLCCLKIQVYRSCSHLQKESTACSTPTQASSTPVYRDQQPRQPFHRCNTELWYRCTGTGPRHVSNASSTQPLSLIHI